MPAGPCSPQGRVLLPARAPENAGGSRPHVPPLRLSVYAVTTGSHHILVSRRLLPAVLVPRAPCSAHPVQCPPRRRSLAQAFRARAHFGDGSAQRLTQRPAGASENPLAF